MAASIETKLPLPPNWLHELAEWGVNVQPVRSRRDTAFAEDVRGPRATAKRKGRTQNVRKLRHMIRRTSASYRGSDGICGRWMSPFDKAR